MNNYHYPKGSEWRKWDLHIHTPCSIIQNFGGDNDSVWESFINDIENLPPEFKVIGINDYIFIDGYRKVLEYKSSGRLSNIDLILPVLEFRIPKFAGSSSSFRKINFHIIFSNEISPDIIQQQFLNGLTSNYKLTSGHDGINWNGIITRDSIRDLGVKIKASVPPERLTQYGSDFEEGFNNLTISEDDIYSLLNNSSYFKNGRTTKFLTAVGKTEWESMSWNEGSIAEKKDLINKVDFVFISSVDVEQFYNAKKKLTEQRVNDLLLDCSDAHCFSNNSDKDRIGKCFTWLKADPVFEGLRQIIYEPNERLYIGEDQPKKTLNQNTIQSIQVKNSNNWFPDINYQFNEGLVSIIGGKGSGKTALLDMIAYSCNCLDPLDEKSFLFRAKNEVIGSEIEIIWSDGTGDKITINKKLESQLPPNKQKVKYLSQSFVEKLCKYDQTTELTEQIESVIYQNIPNEEKRNYINFTTYKNDQLKIIRGKQERIGKKLIKINNDIDVKVQALRSKPNLEEELVKCNKKSLKFKNELKIIKSKIKITDKSDLDKLDRHNKLKHKSEKKVSEINILIRKEEEIGDRIQQFNDETKSFINSIKGSLLEIGLKETIVNDIKIDFPSKKLLSALKERKEELIKQLNIEKKQLVSIKGEIEKLSKKLKIEKSRQEKIEELNDKLSELNNNVDSLKKELSTISKTEKELPELYDERIKLFKEFFTFIFEEKYKLFELYSPIKNIIKSSNDLNKELFEFDVKFYFDLNSMVEKVDSLIDHSSSGRYFQKQKHAIDNDISRCQFDLIFPITDNSSDFTILKEEFETKNADIINYFIDSIEKLFTSDVDGNEIKISDQLKKNYNEIDFYNWLFDLNYYKTIDTLKFNNVDLDKLSPGLKGIALLILFLELDKEDTRPLLIDQPEENLDNRSIYETLRTFFREAKNRRQIILVTHNPNLVVNTDSEQIFITNLDKTLNEQPSYIYYSTGSLVFRFR